MGVSGETTTGFAVIKSLTNMPLSPPAGDFHLPLPDLLMFSSTAGPTVPSYILGKTRRLESMSVGRFHRMQGVVFANSVCRRA